MPPGGGERDIAVDVAILNADAKGNSGTGSSTTADERFAAGATLPGPASPTCRRQHCHFDGMSAPRAPSWARSRQHRRRADCSGADRVRPSDIALVGAAHNGERDDLLILYEFRDFNLTDNYARSAARQDDSGLDGLARPHSPGDRSARTQKRAAKALRQADQAGGRPRATQTAGAVTKSLEALWPKLASDRRAGPDHRRDRRRTLTSEEGHSCAGIPDSPCAQPADVGHTLETQFPLGLACRISISRGRCSSQRSDGGSRLKNRISVPRLS